VLGTINPLNDLVKRTHEVGAIFILDACQSVPHMPVNVAALEIDFLVFSGHKAVGPTGVGVLWGRAELLADLPPFLFGGSMIESVTMTDATWAAAPRKFEPGVPNMAQIIGLGAALNYLTTIGMQNIHNHEIEITRYALSKLQSIEELRVIGPKEMDMRGGAVSFTVGEIHPHDLGQFLDNSGIAVRTGHHCAWPLTRKMGVPATTRASFYLYNTLDDIDALVDGIRDAKNYFG
jgi:cysteine desulfurase/selenocysteine lyase